MSAEANDLARLMANTFLASTREDRDNYGTWEHECYPGGERQRELAFRLGVNLVMYALCLDYKTDQVHVPFIMKRRRWKPDDEL